MKIKTTILITTIITFILSFVEAWELLLEPWNKKFSPWCTIWIDIVMDPEWKAISATDIVIESSMKFIKFEPSGLFPYFLPTKTIDNIVHIVWFTTRPEQRIKEKWTIGKIFFKPKDKSDLDWTIKFYIKKKWDTTDTNMSIWWWVDVLEDTRNGFYTFDWTECNYPEEENIIETKTITLDKVIKEVEKDHKSSIYKKSREDNKSYIIWLFIIIIILALYFKIFKWKSKK